MVSFSYLKPQGGSMKGSEMGCPFYKEWLVRSCIAKGMVLDSVIALAFCKGDRHRTCPFMSRMNAPITDLHARAGIMQGSCKHDSAFVPVDFSET
jgi:hypothetical protein